MRKSKLNPNQKLFCQYYAGGGEYFGNGVWSYVLAYKLDIPLIAYSSLTEPQKEKYNSAKQMASLLLTKVDVIFNCNELIDSLIKDEIVDRELQRVIMQNEELSSKVNAIREYNKLKQRTADISFGGRVVIFDKDTDKTLNLFHDESNGVKTEATPSNDEGREKNSN